MTLAKNSKFKNQKSKSSLIFFRTSKMSGFSLIELLVVIFVFSALGVIVSRSLAISLRGSNKSESVSIVKENVEYTLSTMERVLRNAQSLSCASPVRIDFLDQNGSPGRFECLGGASGHIAQGSSQIRISSTEVNVNCLVNVFVCTPASAGAPPSVNITLSAVHQALGTQIEGSSTSVSTRVQLRSY